MQITKFEKRDEPLFQRTFIKSEFAFDKATPSKGNIQQELGKKSGVDAELIAVKSIHGSFGARAADVIAYAYKDKENMKKLEQIKVEPAKPA